MPLAFTRAVSPRLAECALTHLGRTDIDAGRAAEQHATYEDALRDAGFTVRRLEDLQNDPDAVFVEDTAILLGEHAVITRPGTPSRRDEVESTARGLAPFFTIHELGGGNLDGGDVVKVGRTLYVGQSNRTDGEGTQALRAAVSPLGFSVEPVELGKCLHLKSAVTYAGKSILVANPEWVDPAKFDGLDVITVADDEPFAANVVLAGDRLLMAAGSPATAEKLRRHGFTIVEIDLSELQKAEAGGTCMSLIAD